MTNQTYEVLADVTPDACQHVCSMGCGNEYEFVVVTASDSTTQFLCVPCFVGAAMTIVSAMTEPNDPSVAEAVEAYAADVVQSPGTRGRKAAYIGAIEQVNDNGVFDEFEPDIEEL
jgi:hypothetical protein